jgi:hypothetical protein
MDQNETMKAAKMTLSLVSSTSRGVHPKIFEGAVDVWTSTSHLNAPAVSFGWAIDPHHVDKSVRRGSALVALITHTKGELQPKRFKLCMDLSVTHAQFEALVLSPTLS